MIALARAVCVWSAVCLVLLGSSSSCAQESVVGGEGCRCMTYHLCSVPNITGPVITKNQSEENQSEKPDERPIGNQFILHLITVKLGDDDQRECGHYLEKCCYPADPSVNTTLGIANRVPSTNTYEECGIRNKDGAGAKIVNAKNNEASYGEFPWVVAVIPQFMGHGTTEGVLMECAGTLIHPQVVLTVAHCIKGKKDFYVRAGEWDTQTDFEIFPTQDRDVKRIIVHEDFYSGGFHNDAALLLLESPFELGPTVQTLCLPEEGELMDGRKCVAAGWGKDDYGKLGKYQSILKRVELPIVPRDSCQDQLRKTRLGPNYRLHESFICAGGEVGKDTCRGDGGAALACPSRTDPKIYVQAGITSWGIGCGEGVPGVYTNVSHLRAWIDNKIASFPLTEST